MLRIHFKYRPRPNENRHNLACIVSDGLNLKKQTLFDLKTPITPQENLSLHGLSSYVLQVKDKP